MHPKMPKQWYLLHIRRCSTYVRSLVLATIQKSDILQGKFYQLYYYSLFSVFISGCNMSIQPNALNFLLYHVLTCNLTDNADILRCSRDFCKQANGILFRFILLYRLDCSLITVCPCMAVLGGLLIVVRVNT